VELEPITIDSNMGWSTHVPVLIKIFGISDGPIMEIGSGVYSTPILHWLCSDTNRTLVTYENNQEFIKFAKEFESSFHAVNYVDDFLSIPNTGRYGMIFIDHAGRTRGYTTIHFKDSADYIIIHDSNVIRKNRYQLAFPEFKYRKDFTKYEPWTTVLSNIKELDNLW
jgi:hypothetical protein